MEETAPAVIPVQISTVQITADVQITVPADAVQTTAFAETAQAPADAATADPLTFLSLPRTRFAEPALPAHVPATPAGTLTGTAADVTTAVATTTRAIPEMQAPTLFLIRPAVHSPQAQSFPCAM